MMTGEVGLGRGGQGTGRRKRDEAAMRYAPFSASQSGIGVWALRPSGASRIYREKRNF